MTIYKVRYRKYIWRYLLRFSWLMFLRLVKKNKKYKDTWKKLPRTGQEERIYKELMKYYNDFLGSGRSIPWIDVANLALIAWIRDFEKVNLDKKCLKQ